MPRLGLLRAADLAALPDMAALRQALSRPDAADAAFCHAPAGSVAHTPHGLQVGRNVFGPGRSPVMTDSPTSLSPSRAVTSVVLHDALFVASSMTVIDRARKLFRDGVDNVPDPTALADLDAHYARDAEGALCLTDAAAAGAEMVDCVALPVCGLGFPNYGHFLFDGLPAVLLHAQSFPDLDLRVVGQRLAPWQHAILAELGLADRYLAFDGPVRFRRILASTLLALHVSYPTACIRPLFDLLRFRAGAGPADAPRRVFLSRAGHDDRRRLRNRAAVEAAMEVLGFAILHPGRLSFAEQVATMRGASLVVGESGAAMANIGFCQPGTKVLEIQPERFVEGWTRGMCFQLAHRWHVYFPRVELPPLTDAAGKPLDPNQHFEYEIDPLDLMVAVRAVEAAS